MNRKLFLVDFCGAEFTSDHRKISRYPNLKMSRLLSGTLTYVVRSAIVWLISAYINITIRI